MKLSFKNSRTYVTVNGKTMSAQAAVVKYPKFANAIIKYSQTAKKLAAMDKVIDYEKKLIFLNGKTISYKNHAFLVSYLQGVLVDEKTGELKCSNEPNFDPQNLLIKNKSQYETYSETIFTLGKNLALKIRKSDGYVYNVSDNNHDATIYNHTSIFLQSGEKYKLLDNCLQYEGDQIRYKQPGYIAKLLKENKLNLTDLKVNSLINYYEQPKEKLINSALFTKGFCSAK